MALDPTFPTRVFPIIYKLFEDNLSSFVNGRVYFSASENKHFPRIIYQSQDGGGKEDNFVGKYGWKGLIAVRVLDLDPKNAHDILTAIMPNIYAFSHEDYDITISGFIPLTLPKESIDVGTIHTAALMFLLRIKEK